MTAAAAKLVTVWGLLGKLESAYGGGATMTTTTDGIMLSEEAIASLTHIHSGEHAPAAGAGGIWAPTAPSGRAIALPVKCEARGFGTAYSATNLPPDVNVLLRISGHSATVVTTGGSESVTYAPITPPIVAAASGAFSAYTRGQLWPITGAFADMGFDIDGQFLVFNFDLQGLVGAPTDVALPAITYSAQQPCRAETVALAIGSWSPVVRKVSFKKNTVISARADKNAAGHGGFALGRRSPQLTVTVEAPTLATLDPYADQSAGTPRAILFTVGAAAYKRAKFNAPQCYLTPDGIKEGADGNVATTELTYQCAMSAPGSDNDYTIVFD
jgi:hypothetical protein